MRPIMVMGVDYDGGTTYVTVLSHYGKYGRVHYAGPYENMPRVLEWVLRVLGWFKLAVVAREG